MIIRTPKITKSYLLLKNNGYNLFETFNKKLNKNESTSTTNFGTICNTEGYKNSIKSEKNEYKTALTESKISKKLLERKKLLFIKNKLNNNKGFLFEEYIKTKELKLMNNKNIKTFYDARKTYYTEEKEDDSRNSYINKNTSLNKKIKFPLIIKDIESKLLLLKMQRTNKIRDYFSLKDEWSKYSFKDTSEKFGVKNVFIKSDGVLKASSKKKILQLEDDILFKKMYNKKKFNFFY